VLDSIHSLAALAAFEPASYTESVVAGTPQAVTLAELEARDAYLAAALTRIDDAVTRFMRLRLDRALADDTSIGAPTRKVFAQTIVSYATNLEALGDRVRDLATRGGGNPAAVVDAVMTAARDTLADRDALRAGVLSHIAGLAMAGVAQADHEARDTTLTEASRKKWSAVRRDCEVLAQEPAKIVAAPFAARIASWPEQLDEPPPQPEVHPSDLIELD
jgi:hypothetical protein